MIRGNNDPNEAIQQPLVQQPIQQQKGKQGSEVVDVVSVDNAAPSVISAQSPQFQSFLLQGQIQNLSLPNQNNCVSPIGTIQSLRLTTSQPGQSANSFTISPQNIGRIYTSTPQSYIAVSSSSSTPQLQNPVTSTSAIQLRTSPGILPVSVSPTRGSYQDASGMTIKHLGATSSGFLIQDPRDLQSQRPHAFSTTMSVSHSGSTIHHLGQSPTRCGIPPLATSQNIQTVNVQDQIQQLQQRRPSVGNTGVYSSNVSNSKISFDTATTTVSSNFLHNSVHQISPITSIIPKSKRIKLEEKPPATPAIANYRKIICEHWQKELNTLKESYHEHLTELFFLQNGGNMMDYLAWKKRPTPLLLTFLKSNNVDSGDEEEQRINDEVLPHSLSLAQQYIVKVPASGGTPVAISTTLPAAVTQLSQQGGTPLIGEPRPTTTPLLQPAVFTSQIVQKLQPVDSTVISQVSAVLTTTSVTSSLSTHHSPSNLQHSHLQQRIQLSQETKPIVSQAYATCVPKAVVTTATTTITTTTVTTTTTAVQSQPKPIIRSPPLSAPSTQRLATRQHSISAVYDNSIGSQEQIVERAKQEAYVVQRIAELRKEGLWAAKRLPKVQEPPRSKAHWDYLLEEMQWLATDFAQERKWKKAACKKFARTVVRYHQEQKLKEERAEREEANKMRKIASHIAKEIKQFWANIEKIVQYKQQSRLEEKRKKALDLHLNFIVDQTEKYSSWLTKGLNKSLLDGSQNATSSQSNSQLSSPSRMSFNSLDGKHLLDADFEPESESDDEETIEKEEQEAGEDNESQQKELELLQKEMDVPLEDLIKDIPLDELQKSPPPSVNNGSDDEKQSLKSEKREVDNKVEEYKVSEKDDDDDDEETLDEQEADETTNHQLELEELKTEGAMSLEDLYKKYAGAYDSDFEMPLSESEESSEAKSEDEQIEESSVEESEEEIISDDEEEEMFEIGMDYLINPDKEEKEKSENEDNRGPSKEITDIAATAQSLQPTGNTLSTTLVCTKVPFLLKHQIREYQHIGLDWLVTMHDRKLNGILADEMGLGKTIQTIALLAHLACEKGDWGPHLIVVPTSVMLNWEMEFKKWCPSFKILTYYGSQKERKQKRQGWTKQNIFHICITSYKLVIQDHQSFRRKKWKYFILDEAQNIKNFKSQRWQTLLNFQSSRRLLLTGTPLQNSLMELWSLMHFLMPHVFQSHREFKEWFANPVSGMIEGSHEYNENLIKRLHKVLRPFLLRRLKCEVERQLPKKFEHVIMCRLSKRQRFLYDDFMAQTKTKETLATGNFMSVINILMQLRKVCNHPNLFEARPIISPFQVEGIVYYTASLVSHIFEYDPFKHVSLQALNLCILETEFYLSRMAAIRTKSLQTSKQLIVEIDNQPDPPPRPPSGRFKLQVRTSSPTVQQSGRASPFTPISQGSTQSTPVKSQTTMSTVHGASVTSVSNSTSQPVVTSQIHSQNQPQRPPSNLTQEQRPATVLAASTHPQQLSGYTLQLIQPTQQGAIQVAHLTPTSLGGQAVTSQSITLQVQQTQQGPRFTVPTTQLHQLPGFAQIVQTSSGQHIILTSTTQLLQTVTTLPAANTTTTITTTAIGQPGVTSTVATLSSTTSATSALPRVSIPTTAALSLNLPATPLKPVMKLTPISVLASPHVSQQNLKQEQITVQAPVKTIEPTTAPKLPDPSKIIKSPQAQSVKAVEASSKALDALASRPNTRPVEDKKESRGTDRSLFYLESMVKRRKLLRFEKLKRIMRFNANHCNVFPLYGQDLIRACTILSGCSKVSHSKWINIGIVNVLNVHTFSTPNPNIYWKQTEVLKSMIHTSEQYLTELQDITDRFVFLVPAVSAPQIQMHVSHPSPSKLLAMRRLETILRNGLSPKLSCLHRIESLMTTHFPDLRLIQYDCGKLQMLDHLLRELKSGYHRVLIFTQMTRMLDILEVFLNFHGHIYLRLDGTTKVEQRQALMERFNADKRIFCFILSTRSGGIGVNLTGADTVIFYDSDWNPTMDAQAQDRCHRIGQTRDVHIYRLISDKTVEENILKKANQKRLLGEVAIEGGSFTTAFFKKQAISDLFGLSVDDAIKPAIKVAAVSAVTYNEASLRNLDDPSDGTVSEEKTRQIQFEQALCQAEDETDVQAAKIACAEAATELAEFDETIPLDGDSHCGDEDNKVEEELSALVEQLNPVERYAMNFLETCSALFSTEQLKLAEEQIESQKKDWELSRLLSLKAEEERRANFEDNDIPYTCSREVAYNQMWSPPTPPQDDNDVYIDYSICFLYEPAIMTESQLPPIYVKREHKRLKLDPMIISGLKQKVPKNDHPHVPRSLFDRPTAAIMKMRRDAKLQKMRGMSKPLVKPPIINKPILDIQQENPEWLICEDWSLLQAIQSLQDLPLNLTILSPAQIPNWDLVADIVNANSRIFRSPKQCKNRYECVIVAREEGKILYDTNPKKPKKSKAIYRTKHNRPMRTSQLIIQDNNSSITVLFNTKFELIKAVANKRTPTLKPLLVNPTLKNPKHAAVLAESGINYDQPSTPVQVAAIRADRIAREKQKTQQAAAEQQFAAQRQQQQVVQSQSAVQTQAQQLQPGVALSTTTQILNVTATTVSQARAQRGISATPMTVQELNAAVANQSRQLGNSSTVVSVAPVSNLATAQVHVAQRIASANLTTAPVTTGVVQQQLTQATKNLTPQQFNYFKQQALLRQQQQQQQRLQQQLKSQPIKRLQQTQQQGTPQTSKSTAVTLTAAGVQVTQAQQRLQAQVQKQGITSTAGQKTTVARTMSEAEVTQLLKRQQQLQQQKQQMANPQVLAPLQQQGTSQSQVTATLVKTVTTPATLSAPSVTIPVNVPGVNISVTVPQSKTPQSKVAMSQQQMRQQLHVQLMQQQRKAQQQPKTSTIAQVVQHVQSKAHIPTQLSTVQLLSHQPQKQLPGTTLQTVQNMQVLKQLPPGQTVQQLTQISTTPNSSTVTVQAGQPLLQVITKPTLAPATSQQVTQGQSIVSVATTQPPQRTMQVLAQSIPAPRSISATTPAVATTIVATSEAEQQTGAKPSPYSMRLRNIPKQ